MKTLFLIPLALLWCTCTHSQNIDSLFHYYKKLNDRETRLPAFKDSDNDLRLKIDQLHVINKSRKRYRRKSVQLDILASRVANKMCKEADEKKYISHWNTKGEKPYHRYFLAGGLDHVSENASAEWHSMPFQRNNETISSSMKEAHGRFMAEKAPSDGHKKTCINRNHNFVGIGFYISGNHFRYYEEFIDRYYQFKTIPKKRYRVGEEISITVQCDSSLVLTRFYTTREKKLRERSPTRLNFKGSYLDGSNSFQFFQLPEPVLDTIKQKTYTLNCSFNKPGIYYLKIYHKKEAKGKPWGEEVQASGILLYIE